MATRPLRRASALPTVEQDVEPVSARDWVRRHAADRADDVAFWVPSADGPQPRTWSQVAQDSERAAAGLVRSGLRADQIVLVLLPVDHPYPELMVALRSVGVVVVHVSPDCSAEDVERELDGADVRLLVVRSEADLSRFSGLAFAAAQLFDLDGGRGWDRLLALGAERLVMDPDVVARVDALVDHEECTPRVLGPGGELGRLAPGALVDNDLVAVDGTTVLLGDTSDALVHLLRAAHLRAGGALLPIADARAVPDVVARTGATSLVVARNADEATVVAALVPPLTASAPASRRPRLLGVATRASSDSVAPPQVRRLVVPGLTSEAAATLGRAGVEARSVEVADLAPPALPEPLRVVMGDPALLPRRSRRDPGSEFELTVGSDKSGDPDGIPEESAFVLPSLPLFGGESVLDRLLLAKAQDEG